MNCPKCKSDNTQRLEAVYQAGTSIVHASGSVYGGGSVGTGDRQQDCANNSSPDGSSANNQAQHANARHRCHRHVSDNWRSDGERG